MTHKEGTIIINPHTKYEGEYEEYEETYVLHGQGAKTTYYSSVYYPDLPNTIIEQHNGRWENGEFIQGQVKKPEHINGHYYEGGWEKGKGKHGHGKITNYIDVHIEGEWENNECVNVTYAKFKDLCGNRYEGALKDYKPHGQGTLTTKEGDKVSGEWHEGKCKRVFYSWETKKEVTEVVTYIPKLDPNVESNIRTLVEHEIVTANICNSPSHFSFLSGIAEYSQPSSITAR